MSAVASGSSRQDRRTAAVFWLRLSDLSCPVHRLAGARRMNRQAASLALRLAEDRSYPRSSTVVSPKVRPPVCSA